MLGVSSGHGAGVATECGNCERPTVMRLTPWSVEGNRTAVVKVVQHGRVSVYVYQEAGHRYHLAHCHVY